MKAPQPDSGRKSEQPIRDPLDRWPDFAQAVRVRLDAGRAAYGDRSFDGAPEDLAREIQEELEDVCGWAFVLWERIRRLTDAFSARNDAGPQVTDDHEGAKDD